MIKRKDGLWQDQIKLPGMSKRKYFYGKTQKEVKQKMAAWKREEEKIESRPFSLVLKEWMEWKEKDVSYNTYSTYKFVSVLMKEYFGDTPITSIKAMDVDRYIKWLAGKGYAKNTVGKHMSVINMVFNFAILNGWCENNPSTPVKIPPGLETKRREAPTEEEIEKIKAGVNLPFGLFANFALYTGMRRGELLALRWEDIDFDRKRISVNKSVYFISGTPAIKSPKTEAGKREVILLEALERILPEKRNGYVFGGEKPLTKMVFFCKYKKWCEDADVNVTPHQIRHAYATALYNAGVSDKDAQDLLGHSNIMVTRNVYTHIMESRKTETEKKLNDFFV